MRVFVILLGMAIIFFVGAVTGSHYTYMQWQNLQSVPSSTVEIQEEKSPKEPSPSTEMKVEEQSNKIEESLRKKQQHLQSTGTENLFSALGKALNVFER